MAVKKQCNKVRWDSDNGQAVVESAGFQTPDVYPGPAMSAAALASLSTDTAKYVPVYATPAYVQTLDMAAGAVSEQWAASAALKGNIEELLPEGLQVVYVCTPGTVALVPPSVELLETDGLWYEPYVPGGVGLLIVPDGA